MNENINNGRGILLQTLYIFGNGFDIAHGIRTPYAAFREFLKENHESFLTTFESMYNIQPLDDTEPWYTKEAQERWDKSIINDLWWSFEEKIGHPDVEGMYDSAYSMVDTMPMEGIIDTMNVYWREQYGFVDKLPKYVLEWLQTIDTSQAMCKKDSLINNRNDLFMSFNYTDTLEKVYGIKDVLHLHGGIPSCCEIAPIMGHGNKYIIDSYRRKAKEAQEEYVEWYESICNTIADFCESLYKDTDAIISENDDSFSALWDVNQVVCLGLSFGDVDVPYLDRIEYEVRPETKWLVYYHSDEDLKRLKSVFGITGISRKFEVYFRKSDNFWDREVPEFHNHRYGQVHVPQPGHSCDFVEDSVTGLSVRPIFLSGLLRRTETYREPCHPCRLHFALPGISSQKILQAGA